MENAFKYMLVLLVVLPMFFAGVVAIFSAILVLTDIPFRK